MTKKTSYLEVYTEEVIPRLRAIDMRLKSGEGIDSFTAADLLGITDDEVTRLRHGAHGEISTDEFLSLMLRGSSAVCGLYRRELERRTPVTYTVDDIAYIYGLARESVAAAFKRLNASAITECMLARVFSEIWVSDAH